MKMRAKTKTIIVSIFVFISLILPTALAETYAANKIVDEFKFSGETITAKGKVFTVYLSDNEVRLRYTNTDYIKLGLGSCKRVENLGFCFQEVEHDWDRLDDKARIEVYDLETIVNVTRTITDGSLITGEETTITVNFYNDGTNNTYIKYTDEFPKGIEVTDVSGGAYVKDNVVYWNGTIIKKQDEEIEYKIRAVEDVDATLVGRIFYNGETYYTDPIRLYSKTVLNVDFAWETEPLTIGDERDLKVTLRNSEDDKIDINNLTISFPAGLKVKERTGSYITAYVWENARLDPGQTKNITFKVKAQNSGISEINTHANFDFKDKNNLITKKKELIEVNEPKIYIRLLLDKEDDEHTSGGEYDIEAMQKAKIKVYIQKSNPDVNYTNLRISMTGTLLNQTMNFTMYKLATVNNEVITTIPYTAPDLPYDATQTLNVRVDFETQYGDELSEEADFDVNVRQTRDVAIIHETDPSDPESGEDTIIEARIRNERIQDIEKVYVCTFSDMPQIQKTCNTYNMRAGSELTAQAYKIKTPRLNETKYYYLNTTVLYFSNNRNYSYSQQSTITVKPRELEPTIEMQTKESQIALGGETLISYYIRNGEEETIKDLTLEFQPSQNFDIIGPVEYFVGNVDPGEELNLYDIQKVRAKMNDSQTIEKTKAVFNDYYFNRVFERNSSQLSFDVKDSYFTGAMIITNKTAPSVANASDYFTVMITLDNKGTRTQEVTLIENGVSYKKTVYAGKQANITYETKLSSLGMQKIPRTIITYTSEGRNYTTASNDVEIEIREKPLPEVQPIQSAIPQSTNETFKTPEERKPVIMQIIDFFKNLFARG